MEWKEVRLGDVCEIKGGKRLPKGINLITQKNSHPYIRVRDLGKSKTLELNSSYEYVDEITQKQIQRYITQKGDILISIVGTIGLIAIVGDSLNGANLTENCVKLVKLDNIDSEYLYYFLKSPFGQQNISRGTVGAVQAKLPIKYIQEFSINCPKLVSDQRRIASILSSLDRKIELNNKINADLEEMAQAIFKNWFVDFEPFKDGKFVDSELGMIPEGWKVVVFDNILNVTTTKTGKEGIPEYSVTNTGIHPRDEKFTKNLSKSSAKNKLIRKGNLVFGMSREILNWGIMKEEVGGVSSAYNVYIVDEKIVNTTYLECFIAQRMDYFADLIKPASREGQGVDKALLMKKIICIPPSEVMDVFLEKYNSIMHLTEIRNQENSRLSLLRDTLLPRLMSGELEVPE